MSVGRGGDRCHNLEDLEDEGVELLTASNGELECTGSHAEPRVGRATTRRSSQANDNINRLLSPDGRSGRIRDLVEAGRPVVLLTHWQSLYTQGTGLGLDGLSALAERIQKVFGNNLEWISCSERALRYAAQRVQSA